MRAIKKYLLSLLLLPLFAFAQVGGSSFNPGGVAITGGTINGTTLGATTPAAITGTTITATTTLVVGGTATFNAQSLFSDGSASFPSISFSNGSGFYKGAGGPRQIILASNSSPIAWTDPSSNGYFNANVFGFGNAGATSTNGDLFLTRDAAGALAQYNPMSRSTAQVFRVYNIATDASNYERGVIDWATTANSLVIGTQKAGTGVTRAVVFQVGGSPTWTIDTSGNLNYNAAATASIGNGNQPLSIRANTFSTLAPVSYAGTTYTVLTTDSFLISTGSAASTVTLPAAASFTGRMLTIKTTAAFAVSSASSNVVALAGGAAATAILAATAGKWAQLVSDGTNWIIMAGN